MNAEYQGNEGFLQRDSVEHKGCAEVQSTDRREGRERDGASDLLEAILDRNNLNRAYKRVKRNHGAAGIDGMTVEEALPWLKEHKEELLRSIRDGSYMPSPVRRKEIPKPDGGVRKLGIPTVVDRVIQQAIAQKLQSIWEPLFSDSSYGYRPRRSAQQAIQKVKEYGEEGYRYAVSVDLSKYFDTLNHEQLMNLLHKQIQDMRVLRLIKKYLKSGVMENGVICKTEEGSPQGGPLSPLLANIYLNEFDWEMNRRGVKLVRYTIANTLAICSGMVCDGAKPSCAAKIAAAVDAGLMGYYMYTNSGHEFMDGEGIIQKGVENTIRNVGRLARQGMRQTDDEILRIMSGK